MINVLEKLKYKDDILILVNSGAEMPNLLEPNCLETFRYAFSEPNPNNHLPVYKQNPLRLIQDREKGRLGASGLALSCFDNEEKAISQYRKFLKSNKNFAKLVGDSMSKGILQNEVGRITTINQETRHFDFYEFEDFIANNCFIITNSLV